MLSSSNGFAAICRPSGKPAGEVENPIGRTIAGKPHALNMRRNGCLTSIRSPAGAGMPGVRNTSSLLNVSDSSLVNLARDLLRAQVLDGRNERPRFDVAPDAGQTV